MNEAANYWSSVPIIYIFWDWGPYPPLTTPQHACTHTLRVYMELNTNVVFVLA